MTWFVIVSAALEGTPHTRYPVYEGSPDRIAGDALGVVLEGAEVDSTSGLILSLLRRPPQVGDSVEYDDVRFLVARVEGRGIREAVATALRPTADHGRD